MSENGLLDNLVAKVVSGSIKYAFDRRSMKVKAEVAESFVVLCGTSLKDVLRLFLEDIAGRFP